MSGGAYDYMYCQLEEYYVDRMYDPELDDMMKDLCTVLHDLEWWQSCDTSEESYRESVKKFKDKWFKGDSTARKKSYVDKIMEDAKKKLYQVMAEKESE